MKINFRILLLPILAFAGPKFVHAQADPVLGSWNLVTLKGRLRDKLSIQGEFNTRNDKFFTAYNYVEYKGSVEHSIGQHFGVSAGVGGYKKSLEGNFINSKESVKETRTWEDILYEHKLSRINFNHRIRAEQRFLSTGYKNRYRYRLALSIPINKPTITEKTVYIAAYDELFFGEGNPTYERNKLYAGAGFKFNERFAFQVGNMNQYEIKISSTARKGYIQFQFIYNFTGKNHSS